MKAKIKAFYKNGYVKKYTMKNCEFDMGDNNNKGFISISGDGTSLNISKKELCAISIITKKSFDIQHLNHKKETI